MPWVNLDDQFPEHPKNDRLSDAAFRLHVAGICYANRHLTDGHIPDAIVQRLVPKFKRAALDELLSGDKPQWQLNGSGYVIHDFLDWNRSRDAIVTERERIHKMRSEAGKKGAASRWQQ